MSEIVPILIFALLVLLLFIVVDVLQKKVFMRRKWSRRATHVLTGGIVVFMPLYLSGEEIMVLSGLFLIFLFISRLKKILSLHEVDRLTTGELLYPVSIGIMAWLCLPEKKETFQLCTLLLAISDGFAGIMGETIRSKPIQVLKQQKSLGGSITFFLSAFVLLLMFHGLSAELMPALLIFAAGLTLLELIMAYGLDNLAVPLAAMLVELYIFT